MTPARRSHRYQDLNDRLRSRLASDYAGGDRFLSEREISEAFDVSRATANKVLAGLVSEGVLEFRRGIGTFVRGDALQYDVQSLVSFHEKARRAGRRPSTELLALERVAAAGVAPAVQEALGVDDDDPLWEMSRLRRADGEPVILEHRYVVAALCPRMTRRDAGGSLYRAFTERFGLAVAGADEIIRAVCLSPTEAPLLGVPTRSPALEVTAVGVCSPADESGESGESGESLQTNGETTPLWWERTLYRSDRYEFASRLGPLRPARPALGQLR